jgi:hypothetical protein
MLQKFRQWIVDRLTERRERHGIALSMFIEFAPLDTNDLWPRLDAALDLIATHSPIWLKRMRRLGNSIDVRRIPGTRAMLTGGRSTVLDPYLLANFLPAQIASAIVHEATHALMRANDVEYLPSAPAREERACRRAELRFGQRLAAGGVPGADAVIERAASALAARDDEVGVVVNWQDWRTNGLVTRIKDMPGPRWLKRLVARRYGVLNTPQGRAAFYD